MTEYLLKSDVIKVAEYEGFYAMAEYIKRLPTFPDPSLAVDGDLISRKGLKDEILSQYPEITVEWDAAFNALLRIINSMPAIPPAPSVAAPESGNSKLLEMIDAGVFISEDHTDDFKRLMTWLCPILRLLAERGDK